MIEKYNAEIHYSLIHKWYKDHKQTPIMPEYLPKNGIIVNRCCAGFLYETDSKLAFLENYISDKNSDKQVRNESLDILTKELLNLAKELNYSLICSYTNLEAIKTRALDNGYIVAMNNVTCLARSL